jgi:hypothetical protein
LIVEVTEVEGYPQGGISLLLVTWNYEIGGGAAQIVLREVADKRRLYLVAIAVF